MGAAAGHASARRGDRLAVEDHGTGCHRGGDGSILLHDVLLGASRGHAGLPPLDLWELRGG